MAVQDQFGNAGWITDVFNYRKTHISSRKKEPTLNPVHLGALEGRDVWGEVFWVVINTSYI